MTKIEARQILAQMQFFNAKAKEREAIGIALSLIDDSPDQQPKIVMCKDCLRWTRISMTRDGHCHDHMIERMTKEYDYCSHGSSYDGKVVQIDVKG